LIIRSILVAEYMS